jgi:cytochrome b involved in lipid metabolism
MSGKVVTWAEFEKHIYDHDCWVLVEGNVYNVNDYLVEHPGGDDILVR